LLSKRRKIARVAPAAEVAVIAAVVVVGTVEVAVATEAEDITNSITTIVIATDLT